MEKKNLNKYFDSKKSEELSMLYKYLEEYLKRDNIKRFSIKFKNNQPYMIEITSFMNKMDTAARLQDFITKNGYHNIVLNSERGRVISFENTYKIKLKK